MKGLDGIQGPIYVGTGCVFRRQALYGYDAPTKKKPPRKTCNCLPSWCCLCCGSRKKKKNKTAKTNVKKLPNLDISKKTLALENIEEGIEGKDCSKFIFTNPQFPIPYHIACLSILFSILKSCSWALAA